MRVRFTLFKRNKFITSKEREREREGEKRTAKSIISTMRCAFPPPFITLHSRPRFIFPNGVEKACAASYMHNEEKRERKKRVYAREFKRQRTTERFTGENKRGGGVKRCTSVCIGRELIEVQQATLFRAFILVLFKGVGAVRNTCLFFFTLLLTAQRWIFVVMNVIFLWKVGSAVLYSFY